MIPISITDLRKRPGVVRQQLREHRELVVTARGQPFALLVAAEGEDIEELLSVVRRARALLAITRMQDAAVLQGLDQMTMEEIDAEIAAARRERRG